MAIYDYNLATGFIVPDTSTLKADVQKEYLAAFGSDMNLDDETPQGRLIDIEVTARDAIVRTAAELANQINPNFAQGVFLQTLCALHGIRPVGASHSHASGVILSGTPGTFIRSGSRIATSTGDRFELTTSVTIGAGGTATVEAYAVENGPVEAKAGTLTEIIDGVFGWASVTNPTDATLGTSASTTGELRRERNSKLFILSQGHAQAIYSQISDLAGVRGVSMRTNPSETAATIDGVVLPPHGTWINVLGGEDSAIAKAILKASQAGSPLTAGTSNGVPVNVSVVEPYSQQTYPVTFTRPTQVPIKVRVTYNEALSVSAANPEIAIIDTILQYAEGKLSGEAGFLNGVPVSPFELAAAINLVSPNIFIRKVEVAKAADAFGTEELPIQLWEMAEVNTGTITVVKA